MVKLKGTRTEKNLMAAFAGESQARNRYTYFAGQAKKDGRRVGVPGVTGLQRRSVAAQHLVVRRIRHRQSLRMRLRQRSLGELIRHPFRVGGPGPDCESSVAVPH